MGEFAHMFSMQSKTNMYDMLLLYMHKAYYTVQSCCCNYKIAKTMLHIEKSSTTLRTLYIVVNRIQ